MNLSFTCPSFTLSFRSSSLTASKFGESASSTFVVVVSLVRDRFRSVVTGDVFVTLLRVGRSEFVSHFLATTFLAPVCCCSSSAGVVAVALVEDFCKGVVAAAVVCLVGVDVVCLVGVAVCLVGVAVVCLVGVDVVCLVGVDVVCLLGVACLAGVSGLAFLLLGSVVVASADDNFEAFCLNLQKYHNVMILK